MEEGGALTTEAESSLRLREREVVSAENRLSSQSNSAGKGDVVRPWGQSQKHGEVSSWGPYCHGMSPLSLPWRPTSDIYRVLGKNTIGRGQE